MARLGLKETWARAFGKIEFLLKLKRPVMKCIDILLKLNTINIGCNTHEALGIVLTLISYVQKTPTYICTHMCLCIPYSTKYIVTSYYYYISLYIVSYKLVWWFWYMATFGDSCSRYRWVSHLSGDWSGRTFASKSSGEFAIGLSLLNTFDSFKLFL